MLHVERLSSTKNKKEFQKKKDVASGKVRGL